MGCCSARKGEDARGRQEGCVAHPGWGIGHGGPPGTGPSGVEDPSEWWPRGTSLLSINSTLLLWKRQTLCRNVVWKTCNIVLSTCSLCLVLNKPHLGFSVLLQTSPLSKVMQNNLHDRVLEYMSWEGSLGVSKSRSKVYMEIIFK